MFNRYPSVQHVYHHYESPPCEDCGYKSNTGYFDTHSFHYHLLHTIRDSDILLQRILKKEEKKDDDDNT